MTIASARGAILVQVGVGIFVVMGFAAFVIDYGVLWASRRQAQNAADAGALAGATARAFDETTDPPSGSGAAYQSAVKTAQANLVFGQVPGVAATWDCPPFKSGRRCVQVNVFRDGANGGSASPLPAYFANVFRVTSQRVQATATAIVAVANATNCLRPWMIPDKFSGPDWPDPPAPNPPGSGCLPKGSYSPPAGDFYSAPTAASPGTGYTATGTPNYVGCELALKEGDPKNALAPSFYYEVDLTGGGGSAYETNISSCVDATKVIGQKLETLPGNRKGPTKNGVDALIAQDPTASWNGTTVVNSCAPACAPLSPRIVPIALFSPQEFYSANRTSGRFFLTIVNMLGFFVEGVDNGGTVTGIIIQEEGDLVSGSTVGDQSGFQLMPVLVR
jgi:hypothetical protein